MTAQTLPQPVCVAALYRFAPIADREAVQQHLIYLCGDEVRGTLLVAHEGLNGTIAGPEDAIARVVDGIRAMPGFDRLELKYSTASTMPFLRMKVRLKAEIVTMGVTNIDPVEGVGTYVAPEDWNALISDPNTILIDTRNDYEFEIGTFEGAIDPRTKSFREFPEWFRSQRDQLIDPANPPKVAMFCTGGIRCEKSTAFLKSEGVQEVFHLEGGILKYLETIPEAESLWKGDCFVFDERVAVGHGLKEGDYSLCRACRMPLDAEGRASTKFIEGVACHHCHDSRTEEQRAAYSERQHQMDIAAQKGLAHVGADAVAQREMKRKARQEELEEQRTKAAGVDKG